MNRHPVTATYNPGIDFLSPRGESWLKKVVELHPSLEITFNDGSKHIYKGDIVTPLCRMIVPWLQSWPRANPVSGTMTLDNIQYPRRYPCPVDFTDLAHPIIDTALEYFAEADTVLEG